MKHTFEGLMRTLFWVQFLLDQCWLDVAEVQQGYSRLAAEVQLQA